MRGPIIAACLTMLVQTICASDQIHVWVLAGEIQWQQYSLPAGATLAQLADVAKLHCDLPKNGNGTDYYYDVTRKEADKTKKYRFTPQEVKAAKGAAFVLKDKDIVSLAMIAW